MPLLSNIQMDFNGTNSHGWCGHCELPYVYFSHQQDFLFDSKQKLFCMTAPIFRDLKKANLALFLVFLVDIKRKKMRVRYISSAQNSRKTLQF